MQKHIPAPWGSVSSYIDFLLRKFPLYKHGLQTYTPIKNLKAMNMISTYFFTLNLFWGLFQPIFQLFEAYLLISSPMELVSLVIHKQFLICSNHILEIKKEVISSTKLVIFPKPLAPIVDIWSKEDIT